MGAAITRKFATTGNRKVFFTVNHSSDKAAQLEKEFSGANGIACDFTNPKSLDHLLGRMDAMDLDILVNNALTSMQTRHFHLSDPAGFLRSFSDNVMPTLRITQQAIKGFRKKKGGRIITVLTSYLMGSPPVGLSEYVANKAYLLSLSRSWSRENARYNVISNCVSPSMMRTSLTGHLDERQIEEAANGNPMRRLVTPDEVAETIFLLATASPQINGVNLPIGGGSVVI